MEVITRNGKSWEDNIFAAADLMNLKKPEQYKPHPIEVLRQILALYPVTGLNPDDPLFKRIQFLMIKIFLSLLTEIENYTSLDDNPILQHVDLAWHHPKPETV